MRTVVLIALFLPYAYFGARDLKFHHHGRKVPRAESVLHGVLGLAVGVMLAAAFAGQHEFMLLALGAFVVGGAVDEYGWHRGLPAEESDLHAKEHLGVLIFVVGTLLLDAVLSDHLLPGPHR